ncbi:MAG: adenine nucleotide alpha hydrolase [Acidobacteriota bacterium]
MEKVWLSWSSGKDSAWALHELRMDPRFEVAALFTTVNERFRRIAMHGVRESILRAQARAVGLPLHVVPIPWPCSNEEYESHMATLCRAAMAEGIRTFAFGDLFLEDIREYRVKRLETLGLKAIFPLWRHLTRELATRMIRGGVRARLTCLDPRKLDPKWIGADFDMEFVEQLPPGVDPCGENGEFHTCVTGGPMFDYPLEVHRGEIVERDGFVFIDLIGEEDAEQVSCCESSL